jgi:hypothetical protein
MYLANSLASDPHNKLVSSPARLVVKRGCCVWRAAINGGASICAGCSVAARFNKGAFSNIDRLGTRAGACRAAGTALWHRKSLSLLVLHRHAWPVRHVVVADFPPARLLRFITRQHPFPRALPRHYPCNFGLHCCSRTTSREAGTNSSVTARAMSRSIHARVLDAIAASSRLDAHGLTGRRGRGP